MNIYKLKIHTMGFHSENETRFTASYRGNPFPHELFDYSDVSNCNINDTSYNVTYDLSILKKLDDLEKIVIKTFKDHIVGEYRVIKLSGNSDRGTYLMRVEDVEKVEKEVKILTGLDIYLPDGHNFNILNELYI